MRYWAQFGARGIHASRSGPFLPPIFQRGASPSSTTASWTCLFRMIKLLSCSSSSWQTVLLLILTDAVVRVSSADWCKAGVTRQPTSLGIAPLTSWAYLFRLIKLLSSSPLKMGTARQQSKERWRCPNDAVMKARDRPLRHRHPPRGRGLFSCRGLDCAGATRKCRKRVGLTSPE